MAIYQTGYGEYSKITHQKEIVIFGLCAQIFEYSLLPVALHMIPIVNHPMTNGIVNSISRRFGICKCLVSDKEIEVFYTSLRCKMARSGRDGGSTVV